MNLADYRLRVCRAIGLSTTDADDLALVDTYVNEGVEQFLVKTKIMVRTAALSVVAGTSDYTLDSDVLAFESAWYEAASTGDTPALLESVSPRDIEAMRRVTSTAGTQPRNYALAGADLIMLYPAPESSDDEIHILYVPRPAAMAATADSPAASAFGGIPAEYHHVIESYAKWKTGESEEHRGSQGGQAYKQQFEAGVAMARADLARKHGIVRGGVIPGRRGRVLGLRPGVDTGR